MASGRFSNPRTPNQEDLEIESAFRQVMGEDITPPQGTQISGEESFFPEDDILSDPVLEALLREDGRTPPGAEVQQPDPPGNGPIYENAPAPEEQETESPAITRNRKIILISLLSVALVAVVAVVILVSSLLGNGSIGDNGLILNNVIVAGVNVGGMTQEEAIAAVSRATDLTYTGQNMVVILPDTTLTMTPTQTGARLDVAAAVKAAYDYGRTGSRAEKEAAREQVASGEYHIGLLPYLSLNTDYIRQQLDAYGSGFNSTYSDSYYRVEGEMPQLQGSEDFDVESTGQTLILNGGTTGRALNIDDVYNQVLDAYSFNLFQVDASDAAPETNPEPLDLEAIYQEFYVAPVDAAMDTETFEVGYETYGYGFDVELAADLLAKAAPGTDVTVPMEFLLPEKTYASLNGLLFRDVLGYAETKHTNNANRNNNLALACASINGTVLMPGDVFDYNQTLGERTAEAGYKAAAAYSGGETVLELGGGICQVSSTLYYASLLADMKIVTRSAHSFVSSYITYGMDATVSWGGPEFRFSNNTDYPIRIDAEVSDGYVKISIVGTDEKDYYVKMEYQILSITDYETEYRDFDADNEKGYKDGDVVQTAYTGYTVRTYRCKYDKKTDELISREEEDISRYKARDLVIARIRTAETEDPTEPSTVPSTDPSTEPPTEEPTEPSTEAPTDPPTDSADSGDA